MSESSKEHVIRTVKEIRDRQKQHAERNAEIREAIRNGARLSKRKPATAKGE